MKTGKHVIFLRAGASKTSGYPLANGLRLLMSSRQKWVEALTEYEHRHFFGSARPLTALGIPFWEGFSNALKLFRDGGFATLDEFCKLAGSQFQNEITGLRDQKAGPALRQAVRAHESRPIVERIGRALVRFKTIGRFLPKSLLAEAIKFALGQWSALQVYLGDGRVEIDNNLVENAIRHHQVPEVTPEAWAKARQPLRRVQVHLASQGGPEPEPQQQSLFSDKPR